MSQVIFPVEKRAKAIGFYGASIGLGAVLGQVIGGVLLVWNPAGLGWRAIFLVNVPLCVPTLVGTAVTVAGPIPARVRASICWEWACSA